MRSISAETESGSVLRSCRVISLSSCCRLLIASTSVGDGPQEATVETRLPKFLLNLGRTLPHSPNLVVQASQRRLQVALKLLNSVVDGLWPQNRALQFGEQPLLKEIRTLLQTVGASAPVAILRTPILGMICLPLPATIVRLAPHTPHFMKTSEKIRTGRCPVCKTGEVSIIVFLGY